MDRIRGADEEAGLIFHAGGGGVGGHAGGDPKTPRKPADTSATPIGTGDPGKPKRATMASLTASMDQLLTLVSQPDISTPP